MLTKSHWFAAVAFGLLAAPLSAQASTKTPTITVGSSVLTSGSSVSVTYSNPALAGQAVVIDVDNGMSRGTVRTTITIELDEHGVGTVLWLVPDWFSVNFNAPDAAEINCAVVSPSSSVDATSDADAEPTDG